MHQNVFIYSLLIHIEVVSPYPFLLPLPTNKEKLPTHGCVRWASAQRSRFLPGRRSSLPVSGGWRSAPGPRVLLPALEEQRAGCRMAGVLRPTGALLLRLAHFPLWSWFGPWVPLPWLSAEVGWNRLLMGTGPPQGGDVCLGGWMASL